MSTELAGLNEGSHPDFRLFPNLLYPAGGRIVGFTGTCRLLTAGEFPVWESADVLTLGSIGIDNFVFEVDPSTGVAVNIQPLAYRTTLTRG